MSLYITGSVAFDRIMRFPGRFSDSILPDQIHTLSVSFFIESLKELLGGNAGNIAYGLNLLQEKSIIVAAAGNDFGPYREAMLERNLPLEGISIYEDQLTASCYITTDLENNQIAAFHAAALLCPSKYDFPHLASDKDFGIICPSNPVDMVEHPKLYQKFGVPYIYDPAQQLPMLDKDALLQAILGSYLLIGNDYEISLIMAKTGKTLEDLVNMTQKGVIQTLGEKGSLLIDKNGEKRQVAPVPVHSVLDPTGAGDAYRVGLLKGILSGKDLYTAACYGAVCSAFCIEFLGTQTYTMSEADFYQRYEATFS